MSQTLPSSDERFKGFVVYSGSGGNMRPVYRDAAQKLGTVLAQAHKTLIYGGMNAGLMNVVASAGLAAGGEVVGVIPQKIKDSERRRQDLTRCLYTETLAERKHLMFQLADGAIALPGGLGTVDEVMDILYWAEHGLHEKPLIFVNTEHYWDDFLGFLRQNGHGALLDRLCLVIKEPEELQGALAKWSSRHSAPDIPKANIFPNFEDEIIKGTAPLVIASTSIEDICKMANAHVLAQLNVLQKPIGVFNPEGKFDLLFKWMAQAEQEHFITPHCIRLVCQAATMDELAQKMQLHKHVEIDLRDKWGPASPSLITPVPV